VCGICGVAVAPDERPSQQLLERMSDSLTHRGPDDAGTVVHGRVGLAMRRLSIIDVEGGHQPLANDDTTAWIVFNGEIYNHPELRRQLSDLGYRFRTRSDTEVLLRAYEHWGDSCVEHLNGMFAFAVLDLSREVVVLARDRVGIKPLYYAAGDQRLAFASELKALLVDPDLRRGVDLHALDDYLALEFVPSPRSIVAGIDKLPPGHTLVWSIATGTSTLSRYWDVDLARSEANGSERRTVDLVDELRHVLRESVRKELVSDVPLGVFLSGGLDSSAVASAMAEANGKVKSFSIGFTDQSFDESRHARLVARHLGTDHHELILEPSMLSDLVPTITAMLDEPLGDASIIPTYLLSRFTREHVTVALSGDGGDELFAGYPTLQAHRAAAIYNRLPATLRDRLVPALVNRLPVSLDNLSFDFKAKRFVDGAAFPLPERHARWMGSFTAEQRAELLLPDVRAELGEGAAAPGAMTAQLGALALRDPLNQVLYLDMKLYLEGDILVKTDRASMMTSLEARAPLLNADMVDYVTSLPLSTKLRGLRSKYLLRKAMEGVLPPSILKRPKKGFGVPVARWLKDELREPLLDALSPAKVEREGFFDHRVVSRLVDEHLSGRRDNRKQLWTLFAFERWHDTYLGATP
jgi:asparagine synthase (glutamine-hydrolysing)